MRALCTGPDFDLAVVGPIADTGLRFDIALMHRLGVVFVLDDDVGLGKTIIDVAHRKLYALDHVGGLVLGALHALGAEIVVQDRRIRLHRLDRIDDMGQDLIVDLDQLERLLGDRFAGRRDRRHRMALVINLLARDRDAGHVAARRSLRQVGEVVSRNDRLDAWQRLGLGDVDRFQHRMRMGAAQNLADQHAWQENIRAELGASRHLVRSVMLDRIGADNLELAIGIEAAIFENRRHVSCSSFLRPPPSRSGSPCHSRYTGRDCRRARSGSRSRSDWGLAPTTLGPRSEFRACRCRIAAH